MEESFQTLIDEVKGVLGDTKLALIENLFGHCKKLGQALIAHKLKELLANFLQRGSRLVTFYKCLSHTSPLMPVLGYSFRNWWGRFAL